MLGAPRPAAEGCSFFSGRRRHTSCYRDWSSDVCSSDLVFTAEVSTPTAILATALAGPVVGIAVGVLTSAVNTLRNPTFWPFVVVQVIVALYAGLAARSEERRVGKESGGRWGASE